MLFFRILSLVERDRKSQCLGGEGFLQKRDHRPVPTLQGHPRVLWLWENVICFH